MPVYFNGEVINIGSNAFKSDSGDDVSYNIVTIAHTGGILTLNTKNDFTKYLNIPAIITLTLREQSAVNPENNRTIKLHKLSLTNIQPLPVEPGDEKTVE